ncbi:MAG: Polymer-forming cytoskeletal [Syntrophorhabdus sp. PtaB.Bin047]|jgi:cytoskeletal protein CcmA (bactofilin family)|nr:MAG: Polymer-forming cytoskeletal [Syntrophorhabdus sp. PtaB.Bin047]
MAANVPEIREIQEGQITTVVAEDLEIKGSIRFKSSVMLKGVFEGEIFSEGLLVVGPTAHVTASINTKTLISHGSITGNVVAGEQIVLKNTATHNGDLNTPFVMIENGAVFNGSCVMERRQSDSASEPSVETTTHAEPEPVASEESSESSYDGENEEYES